MASCTQLQARLIYESCEREPVSGWPTWGTPKYRIKIDSLHILLHSSFVPHLRLFTKYTIFNLSVRVVVSEARSCCHLLSLVACICRSAFDKCQKLAKNQNVHRPHNTSTLPQMSKTVGKSSQRAQLKPKHTKRTHQLTEAPKSTFSLFSSSVGISADDSLNFIFAFSRRFRVGRHRQSCVLISQQFFYVTKHQTYADYVLLYSPQKIVALHYLLAGDPHVPAPVHRKQINHPNKIKII